MSEPSILSPQSDRWPKQIRSMFELEQYLTRVSPVSSVLLHIENKTQQLIRNGYKGKYAMQELVEEVVQALKVWADLDNESPITIREACEKTVNDTQLFRARLGSSDPLPEGYADILEDVLFVAMLATRSIPGVQYEFIQSLIKELEHHI